MSGTSTRSESGTGSGGARVRVVTVRVKVKVKVRVKVRHAELTGCGVNGGHTLAASGESLCLGAIFVSPSILDLYCLNYPLVSLIYVFFSSFFLSSF